MPPPSSVSPKVGSIYHHPDDDVPLKRGNIEADLDVLRAYFRKQDGPAKTRKTSGSRKQRSRMRKMKPLSPMPAKLLEVAKQHGLSEAEAMDRMSNLGLVSNEAIWMEDVSDSDCAAAILRAPWES